MPEMRPRGAVDQHLLGDLVVAPHRPRADANGGIAIFEADDPNVILEGIAPFTPFFDFEVVPVSEIESAVPVFVKVNEWRDSVS